MPIQHIFTNIVLQKHCKLFFFCLDRCKVLICRTIFILCLFSRGSLCLKPLSLTNLAKQSAKITSSCLPFIFNENYIMFIKESSKILFLVMLKRKISAIRAIFKAEELLCCTQHTMPCTIC